MFFLQFTHAGFFDSLKIGLLRGFNYCPAEHATKFGLVLPSIARTLETASRLTPAGPSAPMRWSRYKKEETQPPPIQLRLGRGSDSWSSEFQELVLVKWSAGIG